jgi:hypothetical protein
MSERTGLDRERSEDELTGNVFGNLRYLPFADGLKRVLLMACGTDEVTTNKLSGIINGLSSDPRVTFWKSYDGVANKIVEPDVVLEFDNENAVVFVEVKYNSGLSSTDELADDNQIIATQSNNQLVREANALCNEHPNQHKILLLLAKASDISSTLKTIERIESFPDVFIGSISWEDVLFALNDALDDVSSSASSSALSNACNNVKNRNVYANIILDDLCALLRQKGFERFKGFYAADKPSVSLSLIWDTFDNDTNSAPNLFSFDCPNISVTGASYEFM